MLAVPHSMGILVPQPGFEPVSPILEVWSLTLDSQGILSVRCWWGFLQLFFWIFKLSTLAESKRHEVGHTLEFTEVTVSLAGHLPPRLRRKSVLALLSSPPWLYLLAFSHFSLGLAAFKWKTGKRKEVNFGKSSTPGKRGDPLFSLWGRQYLNNWGTFARKKADLTFLGWTSAQLTDLPCWDPGWGGVRIKGDKRAILLELLVNVEDGFLIVPNGGILVWGPYSNKIIQSSSLCPCSAFKGLVMPVMMTNWAEKHILLGKGTVSISPLFFPSSLSPEG